MGADHVGHTVAIVAVTYLPGETLRDFLDSVPGACVPVAALPPAGGVASGVADAGSGSSGVSDAGSSRGVDGAATVTAIILADNGPRSDEVAAAAGRPGVTVVPTGGNLGFGTGANVGAAAAGADAEFLLVANPDVVLHPGSLAELVAAAGRHPTGGAFGPSVTTPAGELYPSARQLPSVWTGAGHAVLGWLWPRNPWTRRYRREDESVQEREVGWLSGSCLLLRRTAFDQVGGFDQRYFMYFEDVDLGDRLARAGWSSIYVPDARVTHIGGHATATVGDSMVIAHHRSAYRYLADRHRWPVRFLARIGLGVRQRLALRSARISAGARLDGRRVSG